MRRIVRALEWVAVSGWVFGLALTGHRVVAPGDRWSGPILALILTVAATATLCVGIAHAIPATFRAWEQGVEYGRLLEREELTEVPRPRQRRLTPVR